MKKNDSQAWRNAGSRRSSTAGSRALLPESRVALVELADEALGDVTGGDAAPAPDGDGGTWDF